MVPTISITGASVSPASGVAQNFTNPVNYTVTAGDGTTAIYAVTVLIDPPSSESTLSSLSLSLGTLNPTFGPLITSYSVVVANSVSSVSLTPTVTESHATIMVNTTSVNSGAVSQTLGLNVGANVVSVEVTAQDGTTTTTYVLTITRGDPAASDATLSSFILSPMTYTPLLSSPGPYNTSVVTGTPSSFTFQPSQAGASVKFKIGNGTWSSALTPGVSTDISTHLSGTGAVTLWIQVDSPDALVNKVYEFTIQVQGAFSVTPSQVTLPPGGTFTIDISNGTQPYSYSKVSESSTPATISSSTNTSMTLNAGASAGTSKFLISDSAGMAAYVTVITAYAPFDPKKAGVLVNNSLQIPLSGGSPPFTSFTIVSGPVGCGILSSNGNSFTFQAGAIGGTSVVSLLDSLGMKYYIEVSVTTGNYGLSPQILQWGTAASPKTFNFYPSGVGTTTYRVMFNNTPATGMKLIGFDASGNALTVTSPGIYVYSKNENGTITPIQIELGDKPSGGFGMSFRVDDDSDGGNTHYDINTVSFVQ